MDNSTSMTVVIYTEIVIDPVTLYVRQVFQLSNYVILCGVISFFGIGANIINICVFVRQGFKDSFNISLMGLAISDLVCSFTMFWTSIFYNPLFHALDLPIAPYEVMCVTVAFPHVIFNRVTSFITAFITLERCLCIAMPLKVKSIITTYRTKVINVSIFISTILLFSPFYFVNRLEWIFNVSRNRSILGLTYTQDKEIVEGVTFFIHSVFLQTVLLITVIICTILLVVKLNQKAKWRNTAVAQASSKQDAVSVKDKKVVKMVTLISVIFIICYVPTTIVFIVMVLYPDFSNMGGRFQNLLFVTWSVTFVLEAVNSSVNIFVYLKMSSKFKDTFCEIICGSKFKNNVMLLN